MAFQDLRGKKRKRPIRGAEPALSRFQPQPRDVPPRRPTPTAPAPTAPAQQGFQQERVSTTRDRSGNVTSYTTETDGKSQTFSPKQWKELIEVRKTGGTQTGDPKVLAQFKQEQERKQREQITQEVLSQQERERITQEVTPKPEILPFVEPRLKESFDIRGQPITAAAGGPVETTLEKLPSVLLGKGGAERAYETLQASLSPLIRTPYVKDIAGIFNYHAWRDFNKAEDTAKEAVAEFDSIIWDVMRGAETQAGSQMRWQRAEDMLDDATGTIYGKSTENPVFFRETGEDLLYEYEQIRRGLNNKAVMLNNLLSVPPGSGRMAVARDLGVWPEELPGGQPE